MKLQDWNAQKNASATKLKSTGEQTEKTVNKFFKISGFPLPAAIVVVSVQVARKMNKNEVIICTVIVIVASLELICEKVTVNSGRKQIEKLAESIAVA